MCPHDPQDLPCVDVILGLREKSFNPVFWHKFSRKLGFLGNIFFQIRISLLSARVVEFWNIAALRRDVTNSGWLLLTFEVTKFSFSVNL